MFFQKCRIGLCFALASLAAIATTHFAAAAEKKGPVKVFILAGDSNCEGKASLKTLEHLVSDPATAETYKHLKGAAGGWAERDDVWIRYADRKGKLTAGYGSNPNQIGIELQFGNVVGDHIDNQVLLIKTAWGGSGLSRELSFKSPSSGGEAGNCYKQMIDGVKDTLENMKSYFPDYDEKAGYEIAGFVWFSGWNDSGMKDYEEKLSNMLKDVRKDLNAPNMKVVIGEMGAGGPPSNGVENNPIRLAQAAVAQRPEFNGTVSFVKTAGFFDMQAMQMFRDGSWKGANKEIFSKIASDRPYHFMGSAKTFCQMGGAMGEAMVELNKK